MINDGPKNEMKAFQNAWALQNGAMEGTKAVSLQLAYVASISHWL
jgi:hypothetical protein